MSGVLNRHSHVAVQHTLTTSDFKKEHVLPLARAAACYFSRNLRKNEESVGSRFLTQTLYHL